MEDPIGTPSANQFFAKYRWAIDIVRDEFKAGLGSICEEGFIKQRYEEFKRKDDPVYVKLLEGMNDEALSKALVSFWTIAQTLATLSYGFFEKNVSIQEMGEQQVENLNGKRPWRVKVNSLSLQAIDLLVGQQERERVERLGGRRIRAWEIPYGDVIERDRGHLTEIASAVRGSSLSEVTLQCNLLVIEPYHQDQKQHAWAIRFVNPKTISSHAVRKQERVNVLRLYAFLKKEKILRDADSLSVRVAEYVPRKTQFDYYDRYPDYFSAETYWSSEKLWKFIGVPFSVVTVALTEAANQFRNELTNGLRDLLPSGVQQSLLTSPDLGKKNGRNAS